MVENEFLEAVKYILDKLREIGANDVIEDITQVISRKVPIQSESIKSDKEKKEFSNISDQKLRELLDEEKYMATIEILENYINTTPKMFRKVAGLYNISLEQLRWEYDKSDDIATVRDNVYNDLSIYESEKDEIEIEKYISTLKLFGKKG